MANQIQITPRHAWDMADFANFRAQFCKMCIHIFLGVPGQFFTENAFTERDQRGIQKPTWELPTPQGTRVMAAWSFNFNGKPKGRPTKNCNPAIFGTFPISMYFWRGNPGASKTPSGTSKKAVVPEICPPEVSLENIREGRTRITIRVSNPLRAQNSQQMVPRSFDRALSFFGVYQQPWAATYLLIFF